MLCLLFILDQIKMTYLLLETNIILHDVESLKLTLKLNISDYF